LHVTQNWNSSSSSRPSGFLGIPAYISIDHLSLSSLSWSFSLVSINASLLRPPVNKVYIFFFFWWICRTIFYYFYSKWSINVVSNKTLKHIHYKQRCTLWKQPELFNIKTRQDFQQRNKLKLTDQFISITNVHIYIYIYIYIYICMYSTNLFLFVRFFLYKCDFCRWLLNIFNWYLLHGQYNKMHVCIQCLDACTCYVGRGVWVGLLSWSFRYFQVFEIFQGQFRNFTCTKLWNCP
jgi:hypothetical protein